MNNMHKFKVGDKVKIKEGVKTACGCQRPDTEYLIIEKVVDESDTSGYYSYSAYNKQGARINSCSSCLKDIHLDYYSKIGIMKKLSNFIKKTVDADTQELLKAGLINGDLEPTADGVKVLNEITWFANIKDIVARAKEMNSEAEAQSKK